MSLQVWFQVRTNAQHNRAINWISRSINFSLSQLHYYNFDINFFRLISISFHSFTNRIGEQSGVDKRNRRVFALDFLTFRNFPIVSPAMETCQLIHGFHLHFFQLYQVEFRWMTQPNEVFTRIFCFQDFSLIHKMSIQATWLLHLAWIIQILTCLNSIWSLIITTEEWEFHRLACNSRHRHIFHHLMLCQWLHNHQLKLSVHKIIFHIHLISLFERHRLTRNPPIWTLTVTSPSTKIRPSICRSRQTLELTQ